MASDSNRDQLWLSTPRKCAMDRSVCTIVASLRTTLCDIQCTTNTPFPVLDLPPPPEKTKQLVATLPYHKPYAGLVGPSHATTKFQKFQGDDTVVRKMAALKRDKETFFRKLEHEKHTIAQRRNRAATKIQATFRGYRARPNKHYYVPKKKPKAFLTHLELYDELCQMAANLKLDPIAGMSLEFRTKASKRRQRIENAAAFRMQRFFRMLYQRSIAQLILLLKRKDKINRAARVVTKAVRYVITKKFVKRANIVKHVKMATKIQCCLRCYQARLR
jgi:hypothetical protein